jgi:hypothetical protein
MDIKSLFLSWFSNRNRETPKAKSVLRAAPAFQAVSIQHGANACCAAKELERVRFLATRAPALPLGTCSMQGQCRCRYVKHADRRTDARRLMDVGMATVLFDTQDRRHTNGRRVSD